MHFQVTLQREDGKSKSRKTRSVRNTVCDVNVTFPVKESVTFIWLRVGITQRYGLVLVVQAFRVFRKGMKYIQREIQRKQTWKQ